MPIYNRVKYYNLNRPYWDIEVIPPPSASPSPTPSNTPTPSITPTITPTNTLTITPTNTPTNSITPTLTPTPSPSYATCNIYNSFCFYASDGLSFINGIYYETSLTGTIDISFVSGSTWTGSLNCSSNYAIYTGTTDALTTGIWAFDSTGDFQFFELISGTLGCGESIIVDWQLVEYDNPLTITCDGIIYADETDLQGYITYGGICPTPSPTPSISVSPSPTPSISVSPSPTPSISVSPSITPTMSNTPTMTLTPSMTNTPTLTPTPTPINANGFKITNSPIGMDGIYVLAKDAYFDGARASTGGLFYDFWVCINPATAVNPYGNLFKEINYATNEKFINAESFNGGNLVILYKGGLISQIPSDPDNPFSCDTRLYDSSRDWKYSYTSGTTYCSYSFPMSGSTSFGDVEWLDCIP